MRDLSTWECEGHHFEGISMMNSDTFDEKRLFVIIFRPVGIVPIGIGKLRRDEGI
jgi:hypothetical protein